jgi:hypothetical protein
VPGIKTMIAQLRGLRPQVVIAHGERELLFASLAGRRARNNARLVFVIHNDRLESRSWVRPFSKMITPGSVMVDAQSIGPKAIKMLKANLR